MGKKKKDSLASAAGKGITLTLKGKDYEIQPITVGDMACFESFLKSGNIRAFLDSADDLPVNERVHVLTEISTKAIDEFDIMRQLQSYAGVRFMLWRSLLKTNPDMNLADVDELIGDENFEEVATLVLNLEKKEEEEDEDGNPPKKKTEESSDSTSPSP